MGSGAYSEDIYFTRSAARAASSTGGFDYDAKTKATGDVKVHENLNPKSVTRESRDSKEHPESLAIAVKMDVTGSLRGLPKIFISKLGNLMSLLIKKGYVEHPQILFGAIGDATCDQAPLQVGQFESDNRMEDNLQNIILEGGGGPSFTESYEIALYFMARHTSIDCYEKRGEKGYLFIVGDELFYPNVKTHEVKELIGDTLQDDIPIEQIFNEVKEKYHVFYIIPNGSSNFGNPTIKEGWQKYLGQNVITLNDPATISECIAGLIGVTEGVIESVDEFKDAMTEAGSDKKTIEEVSKALVAYTANTGLTPRKKASVDGDLPVPTKKKTVKKL